MIPPTEYASFWFVHFWRGDARFTDSYHSAALSKELAPPYHNIPIPVCSSEHFVNLGRSNPKCISIRLVIRLPMRGEAHDSSPTPTNSKPRTFLHVKLSFCSFGCVPCSARVAGGAFVSLPQSFADESLSFLSLVMGDVCIGHIIFLSLKCPSG